MRSRSPLIVLFLTIFLDLLGFGLILPVAPYYALTYHASETEVALLGSAFSAMQFVFVPIWGKLSDRIGRRPVMLFSILGTVASMVVFGAATSYWMLLLARALSGAMTANFATAQAYVADVTEGEDRAKGMGLIGAAFGLGFILGPFAGGQLAALGRATGLGYGMVGYGAASLAAMNFVLAYFLLPETLVKGRAPEPPRSRLAEVRESLTIPGVPVLTMLLMLYTFAFSMMEWTFALLTRSRLGWTAEAGGETYNAYVFGFIGVISAVIQGGLIGRVTRRFGERQVLILGVLSVAVGLAGLGLHRNLWELLVATFFVAGGSALSTPSMSSLVSRRAPADRQGLVLGLQQSGASFARIFGPATGGWLFQHAGSAVPFVAGSGLMLVAFVIATRVSQNEGTPSVVQGAHG